MADETKNPPAAADPAKNPTPPSPSPTAVAPPAAKAKDSATAEKTASDAANKATEARQAADLAALSPEERKARELERNAALEASKVALEVGSGPAKDPDTVESAKVHAPGVDPSLLASHHLAQKFGNDPANPKPAHHIPEDYDGPTVRLTRKTPDLPKGELAVADVHPDMVGDYLRAGWNK